jgi:hypothetical protein
MFIVYSSSKYSSSHTFALCPKAWSSQIAKSCERFLVLDTKTCNVVRADKLSLISELFILSEEATQSALIWFLLGLSIDHPLRIDRESILAFESTELQG